MASPRSRKTPNFPPTWFQVDKYEGIEGFGPREWYLHLSVRATCAARLSWLLDEDEPSSGDRAKVNNVISELRQSPLDLSKTILKLESVVPEYHIGPSAFRRFDGVRFATFEDLYRQDAEIAEDKSTIARDYSREQTARKLSFRHDVDWLRHPVVFHSRHEDAAGLMFVDLALPDSVLRDQFRDWLPTVRAVKAKLQGKPNNPKYHGPDYKNWEHVRLLPCLDLLLWGLQQGHELSERQMTRALFLLDLSKADTVRKTTLPLARDFANHTPRGRTLLHRLRAEVAYELSGRDRARASIAKRRGRKGI